MRIATIDPADGLFFIAGPCLVEGEEMMRRTAGVLAEIAARHGVALILKGSYRKANRTSVHSVSTIGERWAMPDPSTLSRAFARQFGVSPRRYRVLHLRQGQPGALDWAPPEPADQPEEDR